ncbi:galactose oxidase [Pedobacter nyackensis]|uniref:galactose oxidase n=1 Tax=Pedobacter nyackensis TaxID=475255 RepID=UPI00292EC5E2|nr:galactose oxidase [Pedobacter nyackensis]
MMVVKFNAICIFILFTIWSPVKSQSYGLGFVGDGVVKDKRTSLDLNSGQSICLDHNFELSFDLSFMPGYTDYFGYIFRLIDEKQRNIDLIYDMRFMENKHFKLIVGNKISDIAFDIDINKLYAKWHTLKFKFDLDRQEIVLFADGKSYRQKAGLNKECYRILMGANSYKDFKVKDVPPMKIRDIKITEDTKLSYHWPLNEQAGLKASEIINGKDGMVTNPLWIKKMHHDWELVNFFDVKGAASIAMNAEKEELYVIAKDSLVTYNIVSHQLSYLGYQSGNQDLLSGNQSIYAAGRQQLLNFYVDQKLVSGFDFERKTWDRKYISPDVITLFWHPNKFYSAADSSLYVIGGYGQYLYKRNVFRYHFPEKKWTEIKTSGDFTPRYLSALGAVKNGAYILGGYGSATGEQILNSKNIYDLNFYDVKSRSFKKLFEIKPKNEEFAFANSMIINEETGSYYALTFPNYKYNSSLQLIQGSLNSPSYKLMGNSVPYAFHDIHSFADLYYCPGSKRFVAVLLLHNEKENKTSVKIYTLYGPPEEAFAELPIVLASGRSWYFFILIPILIIVGFFVYKWYHSRRKIEKKEIIEAPALTKTESVHENVETETANVKEDIRNTIFLFGNLQLFDKDGEDITKHLSPLIRELFLVVLLYTIKWGRGISSEKLTEILWFDKSADSARNNRSVNIAKLKLILDRMEGCQISKNTGYWMIDFDPNVVKVDYKQYLNIVNSKLEVDKERINRLTNIVHRGSFLSNLEYDWLDLFKSEVSNEIIDTYLHFAATIKIAEDPEFLINLSNYISYFDTVNEEAMVIKCKALVHLGKHSLAKTKFETFSKDYKVIYGEDFKQSFQEILE